MSAAEFSKDLDKDLAAQILKNVSTGIALFSPDDHFMRWCNATFKKQTWFGGAGKSARQYQNAALGAARCAGESAADA